MKAWRVGSMATVCAVVASAGGAAPSHGATCTGADAPLRELGQVRAEKAVICVLNHSGRPGKPVRRDRYVSRAAQRVVRGKDHSVKHITKVLADVGFFRSGGKGFMRCTPTRITAATTPTDVVAYIASHTPFVVSGPHIHVGFGMTTDRWLFIGGRRTNR